LEWLPWAEFCYNTAFQTSIQTSPFKVVYGREPPVVRSYVPSEARSPADNQQLVDRDEFLLKIRERLEQAQMYHKLYYDKKHRDVEFQEGDWVWLKLLHRPVDSLDIKGKGKLGPRFDGPFKIIEKLGDAAYKLQLPGGEKIHDAFHVGILKKFCGELPSELDNFPVIWHGRAFPETDAVLKSRLSRGIHELLAAWKGQAAANTTWMDLEEFRRLYPTFQLKDELLVQWGEMSCGDFHTSIGGRQRQELSCKSKQRKESKIRLSPSRLGNKTES
jgi:hypothetical protein